MGTSKQERSLVSRLDQGHCFSSWWSEPTDAGRINRRRLTEESLSYVVQISVETYAVWRAHGSLLRDEKGFSIRLQLEFFIKRFLSSVIALLAETIEIVACHSWREIFLLLMRETCATNTAVWQLVCWTETSLGSCGNRRKKSGSVVCHSFHVNSTVHQRHWRTANYSLHNHY